MSHNLNQAKLSKSYNISPDIVQKYEACCRKGQTGPYTDSEIEELSLVATLVDLGFSDGDICTYLHLSHAPGEHQAELLQLIDTQRRQLVQRTHTEQRKLDCLDCLRYEMKKQ